jgi:hypothetical protein
MLSVPIKVYATNKHGLKQSKNAEAGLIPKTSFSMILNGRSGSGKTNLLINMLDSTEFYKGHFNVIYYISPTEDDLIKNLKQKIITVKPTQKVLADIIQMMKDIIKKKNINKAPRVLVILDDVQNDDKFMRCNEILNLFLAGRHLNISTILMSQSLTKTPRSARINANLIVYFKGTGSELELISQEMRPMHLRMNVFKQKIMDALTEPYSFIVIDNRAATDNKRFRKMFSFNYIDLS